jgi:hypothetical protein
MQTLCCFRPGRTLSSHDCSKSQNAGQTAEQQQATQQSVAVFGLEDEGHCTASITFKTSEKKEGMSLDSCCNSSTLRVKLVRRISSVLQALPGGHSKQQQMQC